MFCQANASIFKWKVIHLDFRNTSSSKRLISVYYNESQQGLEDVINATLISKAGIVFISYVFNISDHEMVCFLDGEYSCDLEFLERYNGQTGQIHLAFMICKNHSDTTDECLQLF